MIWQAGTAGQGEIREMKIYAGDYKCLRRQQQLLLEGAEETKALPSQPESVKVFSALELEPEAVH